MYQLIVNNKVIIFNSLQELIEYLETNDISNNIEIKRVGKVKVRRVNENV